MDEDARYPSDFKARIAIEAIRGGIPIADLAARHGVPASLIENWKRTLLESAPRVFEGAESEAPWSKADRQTLRESEKRYRDLVEGSLQGIIIHRDHKPLFVNARWAEQLGYTVEEVRALDSIMPLVAPPDWPRVARYAAERMQGRPAPARYILRWVRKDGSWLWTDNYVTVVSWERSPAIQSTVVDIDERVRNEEALRHQRLFIDTVLETIADGVVACDADGKMTLFNRATREFHGISEDTPPSAFDDGRARADLFFADGRTPMRQCDLPLFRALAGEKIQNLEMVIAAQNREPRTVLVNAEALYDKDRSRIGAVAVLRDITGRERVERALRQSEERLAAVINHAPASISLKDAEGRYLLVNEEVARRFGKSTADFPGRTIFDFTDTITAAAITARDREVVETRSVAQREVSTLDIDGIRRSLMVTRFPVFGDDGHVAAIGGISIDISAQKRTEAELRAAKETAEIASRAKTEFLANMSHELRTPLNSIIGFSQIISEEMFGAVGNAKYREYAGDILNSGRNLLDLINDILDVSRIEIGGMPLDDKWVNVGALVHGSVRLVSGRARDASLTLRIEAPDELPALKADERRVRQILVNLLANAIKFTPPGGKVALRAYADDDRRIVFAVSDTGIGIAEDKIEIVLSMFGQVQGPMTRSHDGAGLGLPLCKKLTELHGGVLEIESALGKGTTVRVTFPPERTASALEPLR